MGPPSGTVQSSVASEQHFELAFLVKNLAKRNRERLRTPLPSCMSMQRLEDTREPLTVRIWAFALGVGEMGRVGGLCYNSDSVYAIGREKHTCLWK